MTTWYVWSPIDYGAVHDDENKALILTRKVIPVGQEVSPSDLGLDEDSDGWKELVNAGSVRDYQFPEELRDPATSPQKIVSARIAAMAEGVDTGNLDATVVANLMTRPTNATEGEQEVNPETGAVTTVSDSPPAAGSDNPQAPSGLPQ